MSINKIADCLNNGGVVLLPTDTVYGLAANPKFDKAIEKIYQLKGRPRHMNLPIMIAAKEDLIDLNVDLNENATKLFDSEFVPGALSLVLGFHTKPEQSWLSGREEILVRIPNDEDLLEVLRKTGPLMVTSANAHGKNPDRDLNEVVPELNGKPDLVVERGRLKPLASTMVNCLTNPPIILREGLIPSELILKYLDND